MTQQGGLTRLADLTGERFDQLFAARKRTEQGLAQYKARLADVPCDRCCVSLMGSWGRAEVTSESDHDWMLLHDGRKRFFARPSVRKLGKVLNRKPGRERYFPGPVWLDELKTIGLEEGNKNLTRRMLFLLEGAPVAGGQFFEEARRLLVRGYLDANVKNYRPPRFLLNDVVRYWRTIAVDFEAKHRDRRGEGWGLRNAKLRLSRKILFAGGLLPVLRCRLLPKEGMEEFLVEEFDRLPSDRIADAFLQNEAVDAGVRTFRAYDEFIGILHDREKRTELSDLLAPGEDSELFGQVRDLAAQLEDGLLALLFDDADLNQLVREYLIF